MTAGGGWKRSISAIVGAIFLFAGAALAQTSTGEDDPDLLQAGTPQAAVEAYMERLGLDRLMAEQLADRLSSASQDDRKPIAERLGRMYVRLLNAAETPEARTLWERRGRALLSEVPEADTGELRLGLNKAVYVRAEDVIERGRFRLAEPTELKEAEAQLRALEPEFTEIARRANARADERERAEVAGNNSQELDDALVESRRLRSLAYYYSGWCHYYLAYINKSESEAVEAMKCFGWLLNSSGGRLASVDRLPTELLRYEHVARAALGSALAASVRGNDVEAIRWLDAIADAEGVPAVITDQLLIRRMIVLAEARRWADMEQLVRRARRGEKLHGYGGGPGVHDPEPLPINAARLLAVLTLEADKRFAAPQVEALARTALGDLVARQEIAQVLDLVRRYGTAPIGDAGFIVHYVRGLLQYDQARTAHKKGGASGDDPTDDPEVGNLYRAAATMLDAAIRQPDAGSFFKDRGEAAVMLGRCVYYAGDLRGAGEKFAAAWDLAGKQAGGDVAEEALWLAVYSFDRAAREVADGREIAERRRAETSAMFLASFPESPRAARIVLLQAAAGGEVGEDEALRILSEVGRDSPVYETARRQVARMLYGKYRSARGAAKDLAAMRFLTVAEELLAADRRLAMEGSRQEAAAACERFVVRVRQMLDALLGVTSPDADRAATVLEVLQGVATYNSLNLTEIEPELVYRRFQIALARNQDEQAAALVERLIALGAPASQFSAAADRLIYKRLAGAWASTPPASRTSAQAAAIVGVGRRVIDQFRGDATAMQDAAVLTLYSTVAAAATQLADAGDADARSLAIAMDEAILKTSPRLEESLRRLAHNAEAAGRTDTASECWRVMQLGLTPGAEAWFEARFESLRLLATADPGKAKELLRQHMVLYPEFGPSPWGEKLRTLDESLVIAPASAPPASAPASPGSPQDDGSTPPASGGGGGS